MSKSLVFLDVAVVVTYNAGGTERGSLCSSPQPCPTTKSTIGIRSTLRPNQNPNPNLHLPAMDNIMRCDVALGGKHEYTKMPENHI